MDTTQIAVLTLIRSGLTGQALPLPEHYDLQAAFDLLERHRLIPMAYEGAIRCGLDNSHPVVQQMFRRSCGHMLREAGQQRELQRLFAAFEAENIDYLPLKGTVISTLYRKPELRPMADADVLIRRGQYDKVRQVMQTLGFTETSVGGHDFVWDSPMLHLELHWRLTTEREPDYYSYMGDGWNRAIRLEPEKTRYGYSDEDHLIYMFMHYARHYRDAGIGLKHTMDFWVYERAKPHLDQAYIHRELEKMHLAEFYENIRRMLTCWLEDRPWDEKSRFIMEVVLQSSAYGKKLAEVLSSAIRATKTHGSTKRARLWRWITMAFQPLCHMRKRYPILNRFPFLLPVFWPVRWVTALLFRRGNIKKLHRDLGQITRDQVETYQQALRYAGLDFHFREQT